MQGGWHLFGLTNWFSHFVCRVGLAVCAQTAEPPPFTITDQVLGETYAQPVGCLEPAEGEWHVTISWVNEVPCKPESKRQRHATVMLGDPTCTKATPCALPRPGETFRATMILEARDGIARYEAQAIVNVLRHEPPYVWLAIETERGEVWARGELRAKLYKKLDDRVAPESWRAEP
jgi:hypothetical protein